jgi:hypothetical protein
VIFPFLAGSDELVQLGVATSVSTSVDAFIEQLLPGLLTVGTSAPSRLPDRRRRPVESAKRTRAERGLVTFPADRLGPSRFAVSSRADPRARLDAHGIQHSEVQEMATSPTSTIPIRSRWHSPSRNHPRRRSARLRSCGPRTMPAQRLLLASWTERLAMLQSGRPALAEVERNVRLMSTEAG